MAKVDNIIQQIRNAQADAIRKNGTANGQAIQNDTVKFLKESISQQQSAGKDAVPSGQAETPALPEVQDTRTTQQKHDDAKKTYDDYVSSDEYKQNQVANLKAQTDEWMNATIAGSEGYTPTPRKDQKEQQLKAEADYWKAQVEAEENQKVMDADLEELAGWSEQDRRALEQYATGQDVDFYNTLNFAQNGIQVGTAEQNAAGLFEKYGKEKVDQIAESFKRNQSQKLTQETAEAGQKHGDEHAVLSSLGSVATNTVGGVTGVLSYIRELGQRSGRYSTLDPNSIGNLGNVYSGAVRGQVAQNIAGEDGSILRQGAAYLYQGGMTMVDSFARAAAGGGPGGAAALAACNAFSQTVSDASRQGATPEQAYTLGVAVAGVEYLSEKIPMDRVFKLAKAGDTKVLVQAFKQAGIEISTEELSLLGSMAAEAAILQEKSTYKQQIGDLVAGGASYEEAKTQADKAVWEEVKQTALVSGFAGSLSGGGAAIVGNLTTNNAPEVTAEAPQEVPAEVTTAAPVVEQAEPSAALLVDGIQDMTPAPAPLTKGQRDIMAAMDGALGVQPAQQPVIEPAAPQDETAYHDEFEDWGKDFNRDGVENPLSDRSYSEVGKRSVKAYMYENPAVKPFYQEQAAWMLSELSDSTKGERTYNEQLRNQQNAPKPKKDIYFHLQSIAPEASFFDDNNNITEVTQEHFTLMDDNSVDLDLTPYSSGINRAGAIIDRFGVLYDFALDGEPIDPGDPTYRDIYVTFEDVERPIPRKIDGGSFVPDKKGVINLYSDMRGIPHLKVKTQARNLETAVSQKESAPVVEQAEPSAALLVDGIQDMTPAPAPLTKGQRDIMAAMDGALGVQPAQQPAVDTAPAAEYDNSNVSPVLGASVGNSGVTYTSDNQAVPFQYAVVPAESLITSNDQFGNVNSAYPAELQPRDRTRTASQIQISKMAQNLNPALLAESATAENGAPIIRGDGVVVGGNARVNAIGMAYGSGNGGAYQQFITEKAAELGIDPATLPANPVLVRITNGVDNYTGLATALNETGVKTNSPSETAKIDASKMGDIIKYLSVGEDGDLNTAENREFIQQFTTHVVPSGEQDTVMQGNSQVSQAGVRRMQYALFHYAYNDTALLERLAESTDNNAKNITNAMVATAGKIAQLQTEIARGEVQDLGLQNAITDAVNLYLDAKAGKQTVTDAAGQLTMGDNGPEAQYDGLTVHLAKFLESNNRSGLQIRKFIDILVDVNMNASAETATEVSMFDTGEQQTQEGLYDEAITAYDQQRDGKGRIPEKSDFSQYRQYEPGKLAGSMDGGSTEGNPGTAVPDGGIPQTVQGDVPGGQRNLTEPNPGIKGTGAAERNFSGKEEYNNLLYDGNVQRDRPADVRSMEVPKRDSDGRRVTEFAANAYAAEVTPDHMASEIESLIQDKELSFDTRSNQESLHNAAEAIEETGEEETRLRISRNASENRIQDGDIEQGLLLYTKYAADPEMQDQASSLLVDLGKLANMSGRNLQMFSLLRRMTPEGRVMTVQKNVARYVQDINKGRSARQQIDSARIIDKDLEQQLRTATTDEKRQEIENAIYKDVASQIKPTLGEAWDAWRNLAMLGNFKTHERNFFSTGAFKPYTAVKRSIGAALERVFVERDKRTKAVLGVGKEANALLRWARADAKSNTVKDLLGSAGTAGDDARSAIQDYRKILPGPLDAVRKANLALMENEDKFFKRGEYARSLAGFLKARGYTAEQLQNNQVPRGVLDEARQYAIKEAQKATFNDRNEFTDNITKLSKTIDNFGTGASIVRKGILPYVKTPANVVKRFMEYNPVSMMKTMLTAKGDIDSGRKSAADVVDEISAGLTGTAAIALGAALAAGVVPGVELIGSLDDEDEVREGAMEYSIRIGGKYYSVAWLAPAMIPLFMGANLYQTFSNWDEDMDGWDLAKAILLDTTVEAINPMLELSMLSSLNNFVDAVSNEETAGDKAMAAFMGAASSYFIQGIPTIAGQFEQATEESKNSTYVNTDNELEKAVKKTLADATKRIPGVDLYQTEKLNEWGEPVKNEGSPLERAMAAMFNPSSETEAKDDPLTKEITRLNRVQTENVSPPSFSKIVSYTDIHGNIHENIRLTEEQYQTMARTQGQTSKRLILEMLLSDDYKVMTDEQKAKAITLAYAYARETAEKATFQDHEGYSANWMNDAAEGEPKDTAAYIMRRITNSDINSAMTSLDSAWDKNHDQAIVDRWMRELDTAYNAYSNMSKDMKSDVREFATGTTAKYLEARDNGVSHEDFLTVAEGINSVKGTGKYNAETGENAVREIDRRRVIANANISTTAKDKLMMAYMEDYEHGVEGTDTSELKYQYIRQELGLSPQDYIKAYEVDLAGGKWRDIRSGIMKTLGCDYGTANKLLLIFEGRYKQQLIDWYTS